jgi:esterase
MDLNFKVFGEGKPLVILHGLLGSLDNWQSLAKKFAESRKVYLIDQRNHGKSPHLEDHDYPSMVTDLKAFLEKNEIENADLLGHSMGGKTVMGLAVEYPFLVNKLIVVDIAPRHYPVHHDQILAGLNAVNFDEQKSRSEVEEVLTPFIPEATIRQFLMKNLYWIEKEKLAYRFNLKAITKDIEKIGFGLAEGSYFTNPTLFIDGEDSDYIQEDDHDLIDEVFPRNEIITFENCGHWVHAQNPSLLIETVEKFLDS